MFGASMLPMRFSGFNPNSQLFEQIPGSLVQIAIGLGSGVWGINASNEIFKFFEDIVIH